MTVVRPSGESDPFVVEIFDPLPIEPNRAELLRCLGYPTTLADVRVLPDVIEQSLCNGSLVLEPRGMYAIYRLEHRSAIELKIGGLSIRGQVGSFLKDADRVVAFAVTVGESITGASRNASQAGDIVASWALDALGSWAAEAAAEALAIKVGLQLGEGDTLSARFSPGYCGIQLREQQALFKLLNTSAIGLELLPSFLMQPMKSVSGLIGIGTKDTLGHRGVPCDRCQDTRCTMRR